MWVVIIQLVLVLVMKVILMQQLMAHFHQAIITEQAVDFGLAMMSMTVRFKDTVVN